MKAIEIHITEKCMYDCEFCSVSKREKKEPSLVEIKKDIELASKNGFKKITLSGGEPLLRNDLVEIVNYANEYYEDVFLETHGFNLTEKKVKNLVSFGLTGIKLSCHSNNPLTYEKITGNKNSYYHTKKALKLLKSISSKIDISTNTVITKSNYKHLREIIKWIHSLNPYLEYIRVSYPRFYNFNELGNYSKENIVPLPKIKKELNLVKSLGLEKLFFENIPLCISDLESPEDFTWDVYLVKNGQITKGLESRKFLNICDSCEKKKECQGLHKYYSLYFNEKILNPY